MSETQTQATASGAGVRRSHMLIGGEWVESQDGRWLPVESPAHRGSVIAEVPRGGAADVDRAVAAAQAAFDGWKIGRAHV